MWNSITYYISIILKIFKSKDDSQCCETAAKCTGAETKVCTVSALTCKDNLNKGVKYYKKENE